MNNSTPVQIIDIAGNTHTIEITADGIMLNGRPCQIKVKGNQIAVLSADPAAGIITITPAALWHAFAGGDPTPESAGLIQAQALAHWSAMQEISLVLQRLRHLVDDVDRQLHHFGEAPLPAYHFDPFTFQLLHTYDGTEEHIAAVAKLLKQPSETIRIWLTSVGLMAVPDHEQQPLLQGVTAPEAVPDVVAAPGEEQPKTCRWTPVMIQQLTAAFFASDEPSISAVSRAIAGKYGWPSESVEYKIYQQGLPRQREQQRHQQDIETSAEQEEGQPDIAVGADVSRPCEISAEQKEVGQTEEAAGVKAHVPELEDSSCHLPASLSSGNFLWDVKIDGKLQRWPLDVAYGMFPFSQPGTPLVYREQQYVLQQVGTSVIAVTQERRTAMQVASV
jgi:hypothetical protein